MNSGTGHTRIEEASLTRYWSWARWVSVDGSRWSEATKSARAVELRDPGETYRPYLPIREIYRDGQTQTTPTHHAHVRDV